MEVTWTQDSLRKVWQGCQSSKAKSAIRGVPSLPELSLPLSLLCSVTQPGAASVKYASEHVQLWISEHSIVAVVSYAPSRYRSAWCVLRTTHLPLNRALHCSLV